MMLALMLSMLVPAPPGAGAVRSDDPPIRVWLNQDSYFLQGDKARVNVKLADDGYVVVLRADAEGRVRVLFPLDPGQDDFVRGGDKIEVRGRGDREAFYVDDREGQGVVLAARAGRPRCSTSCNAWRRTVTSTTTSCSTRSLRGARTTGTPIRASAWASAGAGLTMATASPTAPASTRSFTTRSPAGLRFTTRSTTATIRSSTGLSSTARIST